MTSDCHCGKGSFIKKGKMRGWLVQSNAGRGHNRAEDVLYCLFMRSRHGDDSFRVTVFGYRQSKRTAPELRAIGLFVQTLEDQTDLMSWITHSAKNLMQRTDDTLMAILEIGCHEMVLGREVSIERCFCNIGSFDNAIYSNGSDPFSIKKRTGCGEDMV